MPRPEPFHSTLVLHDDGNWLGLRARMQRARLCIRVCCRVIYQIMRLPKHVSRTLSLSADANIEKGDPIRSPSLVIALHRRGTEKFLTVLSSIFLRKCHLGVLRPPSCSGPKNCTFAYPPCLYNL